MKRFLNSLATYGLLASAMGTAFAKLPPLNDEAKAKAAEATARTAWSGQVEAYQLCRSQEKIAASYFQKIKATGGTPKVPTATPPCADPGAFNYAPPDVAKLKEIVRPIESSGAHSPAATAVSPPSSKQPDSVINPAKTP